MKTANLNFYNFSNNLKSVGNGREKRGRKKKTILISYF